MTSQLNYIGAIVFWIYILAALFFSRLVLQTIVSLPHVPTRNDDQRRHEIKKFSLLAALSFATLSFNMLRVLIQSFGQWKDTSRTLHAENLRELIAEIGTWSVESSLFREFGEAIVADPARFFWTQAALLVTLSVCFDMAVRGCSYRVPRLWAFFGLSQILPISFAQNLFCVMMLRLRPPGRRLPAVQVPVWSSLAVIAVYGACLIAAPHAARSGRLIETIFVARAMLICPLVLVARGVYKEDWSHQKQEGAMVASDLPQKAIAALAVALVAKQGATLVSDGGPWTALPQALVSHPAVGTLGCDFLLSVISAIVWARSREGLKS